MRICCIINDRSGNAQTSSKTTVNKMFAKHGVEIDFYEIQDGNSISDLAKEAVKKNYDTIVAGGGDGTLNAVATALVDKPKIKFGILPLGTLNHFAGALNIPLDLEKAVETIVAGHTIAIDVGEVNGYIFLNNSSLGLYPAIVRLREIMQKSGWSKWPAATWAAAKMFTRFRRLRLKITSSAVTEMTTDCSMLFIGNNTYEMNLSNLGKRPTLVGGNIWVMVPNVSTRWNFITSILASVLAREKHKDIITFNANKMNVMTKKKILKVAIDGEVVRITPPLSYRIQPKSLRVIVPAETAKK